MQFKAMLHVFGSIANKRCDGMCLVLCHLIAFLGFDSFCASLLVDILPFIVNTAPEFWSTEVLNHSSSVERRFKAIR